MKCTNSFKEKIKSLSIVERRTLLILIEAGKPLTEKETAEEYHKRWGLEYLKPGDFNI